MTPSGTSMQGGLSGAGALLAHLRQHPEDLHLSPASLADRFDLNDTFVRTVLEGVKPPTDAKGPKRQGGRRLKEFWSGMQNLLDRISRRPVLFCAVTVSLWAIVFLIISSSVSGASVRMVRGLTNSMVLESKGYIEMIPTTLAVVVLLWLPYRKGMSRFALIAAAAFFVGLSVLSAVGIMHSKESLSDRLMAIGFGELGWFALAGLVAGIGSLLAVVGGAIKMRRADRLRANLSRHELLSRYFEVEERLQHANASTLRKLSSPVIDSIRRRPWIWAAIVSFSFSASMLGLMKMADIGQTSSSNAPIWFAFVALVFGFASFGSYIFIAFTAGTPGRATLSSCAWSAGGLLTLLLPLRNGQFASIPANQQVFSHVVSILVYAGLGALIGVGAVVQRQATRDRMLANNDPATLLAELLQIQYSLSEGNTQVCVLVVDAVKSASMKATADPLKIEFSFRAYQAFITRVCEAQRGRIYKNTGDGAIAAFGACNEALIAAHTMQAEIGKFNAAENRLDAPFLLRIGLHIGEVVADLEKVEFTEVIDIAAHVEHSAPAGGIALTGAVADQLEGYHFQPLHDDVDGYPVLVSRDLPSQVSTS